MRPPAIRPPAIRPPAILHQQFDHKRPPAILHQQFSACNSTSSNSTTSSSPPAILHQPFDHQQFDHQRFLFCCLSVLKSQNDTGPVDCPSALSSASSTTLADVFANKFKVFFDMVVSGGHTRTETRTPLRSAVCVPYNSNYRVRLVDRR